MSLARTLALVLVLVPFAATSGDALAAEANATHATTATTAATATAAAATTAATSSDQAFLEARRNSKKAKRRADSDPNGSFALGGCMTDPSKCTCQNEDAKASSACGDVLGYFCRESTQQYLAASCMDLFGGATVCKCASAQQITSHLKAEETAAKKKSKKKKGSSKKKSSKKK